jgi:uncharacterized protein GlcG (DUF336 family)
MRSTSWTRPLALLALGAGLATAAQAQSYGANVSLEQAHKVMHGAMDEAKKQGFTTAVAVVDTAGQLVMFEKIDGTQTGSIAVSQDKAVSAALYKRPTKALQDGVVAKAGADALAGK